MSAESFGTGKDHESLAGRLRQVREELFGERGVVELARGLGLPARTWENYERGSVVSGEAILKLIELTGVHPHWLLYGVGEKYRITQRFVRTISTN